MNNRVYVTDCRTVEVLSSAYLHNEVHICTEEIINKNKWMSTINTNCIECGGA